jgi:hypothetical protein
MSTFYTSSFLLEQMTGVHNLGSDVLKLALFTGSASLSQSTTAYSTSNEASNGDGYTTGGATLTVSATYPKIENGAAATRIENVSWNFTAPKAVRYGLVYNSTQANRSIMVFDFGPERNFFSVFSLSFPLSQPALFTATIPAS